MSYDLEVRSDDNYTRTAAREEVTRLLEEIGCQRVRDDYLVLEDGSRKQHMEIDLGLADEKSTGSADNITSVGIGVPYPFLEATGATALHVAFTVASRLGWRVFDPQADSYLESSQEEIARDAQVAALKDFSRIVGDSRRERGFLARVFDRLLRQTAFSISIAALAGVAITGYAIGTRSDRQADPRGVVGVILLGATALLVLRPLVAEWLATHRGRR